MSKQFDSLELATYAVQIIGNNAGTSGYGVIQLKDQNDAPVVTNILSTSPNYQNTINTNETIISNSRYVNAGIDAHMSTDVDQMDLTSHGLSGVIADVYVGAGDLTIGRNNKRVITNADPNNAVIINSRNSVIQENTNGTIIGGRNLILEKPDSVLVKDFVIGTSTQLGSLQYIDGNQGPNKVLVSGTNGVANWQTASIGAQTGNAITVQLDGTVDLGGTVSNTTTLISGTLESQSIEYSLSHSLSNTTTKFKLDTTANTAAIVFKAVQQIDETSGSIIEIHRDERGIVLSKSGGVNNTSTLTITDGSISIKTTTLTGMSYAADYYAMNMTNDRWIPDKAYVNSKVAAGTPTTAKDILLADGVQSTFTLSNSPTTELYVAVNGLIQEETTHYSITTNVLTFTYVPTTNAKVQTVYFY